MMTSQSVKPVPEGYHTITPYLIMKDANAAIRFYEQAFDAKERMRFSRPDGHVNHAELEIGDSLIMLADEFPEMETYSPAHHNGSPLKIHLYVPDVDSIFQQAVQAGAKVIRPLEDQFYGDRLGALMDPDGYTWYIASRKKNMTESEIQAAASSAHGE